ncbi:MULTISPECIES: CgeB family protein [unclassified Pseudoclavibacter]|uniref:CgeB family protein n=1 Tax=unclassified Pseudoclavibacter TaxID=2615177 RepID=UPI001BAD43D9|nr:glycosyltransferase [Pseudoclavibacter sp. Marseille-Q4354]MBS3180142.1 glycosyltransferase [Pseudoclavibacter sp. Marseille-Q4354]
MSARRLLLLSPGFHGYWRAISAAFKTLGYDVHSHPYDEHSSVLERAQNKLMHELPESLRWRAAEGSATDRAISVLRSTRFDAVVVVKGDQLGAGWWDALAASNVPSVVWLYDEIRRTRYTTQVLSEVGPIASYSLSDVEALRSDGLTVGHVPLGFDSLLGYSTVPSSSLTLVGARYENREALVREVQAGGVPVRAYGREWSRNFWDVVRTRRITSPGVPSGPDLGRSAAYGVMAGSLATLNIHSDQDGFTMRTFEAAGVGALELVDRADVADFYEVGEEVLVFEGSQDIIELLHRAQRDTQWSTRIRTAARERTLAEHTLVHRARALEAFWV